MPEATTTETGVQEVETTPVVVEQQQEVASTPTSMDDSSWLSQFSERTGLEIPSDVASLDDFAERVDRLQQRASLIPDDVTAERVKAWQDAEAFRRQVSSRWDEFTAWDQQQRSQPVAYEQATAPVQQQVQPPVQPQPVVDEWKPRWEFPSLSDDQLRYLEQDENGRYRPRDIVKDSMQAMQLAEQANRASMVTQDFFTSLSRDPYKTASELFQPELRRLEQRWETERLAPLQAKIAELQQSLNPIIQTTQLSQLEQFEAPYESLIYTDATKSAYTPAGEAYATLASQGMPVDRAIQTVQKWFPQHAQPVASPVVQQAPAVQQKPQSFIRKRVVGHMSNGSLPVEQTGMMEVPIDSHLMSTEQLMQIARARAERIVSAVTE